MWWFIGTIAAMIAFAGWILCKRAGDSDDDIRRMRLCETARRKYPSKSLIDALDALYVQTLREIIKKKDTLEDLTELEEDLMMILSERNRLIKEEVDEEQILAPETKPFIQKLKNS